MLFFVFSAWCDDQDSGILAEGSDDSCHLSHSSDSGSGSYQVNRSVSEDRTEDSGKNWTSKSRLEDEVTVKEKQDSGKIVDKLRRKHSRASSVDRREIFEKYINNDSEHADNVKLFTGDNSNNILNNVNTINSSNTKQLRVVKLRGVSTKTIGVILAKISLPDLKCHGYHVINMMPEGLAKRLVLKIFNIYTYLSSWSVIC